MEIRQRPATPSDLDRVIELYGPAEAEQVELREAWGIADGIAAPQRESLAAMLDDPNSHVVVGMIDEIVFGFSVARLEELLPQAEGERVGVIHQIYVEEPARRVGVAEAMLGGVMEWFDARGIKRFDAIVSPGHRLAKNFFESAGFKARRITMYRHDG
ncbi:MAG: GNAT family N-acetyltransferase [Acidimicrobiia bacterium]|nr:GNAT family N-acetyltransferase [Acidimicrobiia bacterium]